MSTSFQIHALPLEQVKSLFTLTDQELIAKDARRLTVDAKPGNPCRVSLCDAEIGEKAILFPYTHHDVDSPYQAAGPIIVRENATTAQPKVNEIPEMLLIRLLSVRAYDADGMLLGAEVVDGKVLEQQIHQYFSEENIKYIHVHNAKQGCFNCWVERA
ncbi:MAG: DUF1203 domain-containing protein [candidate division Zixibacteria bacterium]|nr:DUF1203 domain-containing protein [candidate division Zixibacteria bacterium]